MRKYLGLLAAAGIATLGSTGAALAQAYPANVVGEWSIRANDTQLFTFTVQQESSDTPCALITGIMGAPNDPITGYYCPATGAVSFLRNSANTGATYQVFTGQVSWAGSSSVNTQLTGNFTNYAGGNNNGAFSFAATLPPAN
jgi:hypothetical protein